MSIALNLILIFINKLYCCKKNSFQISLKFEKYLLLYTVRGKNVEKHTILRILYPFFHAQSPPSASTRFYRVVGKFCLKKIAVI